MGSRNTMNEDALKEWRAFHDPKYFLTDILECNDWLYPWQRDTFLNFYKNDYKELVACVGQRCLHPETKVLTVDGSYKKVEDLDDGDILYGMKDGKIKTDNCLVYENDEEKRIVEVETYTGKKIKLSYDHKVYTQRGLVKAENLKNGDGVYVPYETDVGYVSDSHQAKILGYMIGDGTFRHSLGFSQKDENVLEDLESSLKKRYDCVLKSCKSREYDYRIIGKEKGKNKFLEEVRNLGLWMKDSHTKFVPDRVFRYDEESLINFLRAYFVCDGTVGKDNGVPSLSSVSGRLLRDVNSLLLKLGIRSYIDYETHKHGYRLFVKDKEEFKNKIGNFRKNKININTNNTSPMDKLPFSGTEIGVYRNDVRYDGIRISNECNLTNQKLREIYNLGKHNLPEYLNPIINEEAFFDRVINVEEKGKSKTYDITMPKLGNFFAEDVLVKNSGKTLLSSLIATYELFKLLAVKKPNTYYNMPKGSDLHIMCIATNQQQSKDTVFSEIESRIDHCEWFKNKNYKKRSLDYEFKTDENSIHIRAEHSNSASLAGHTSKAVVLDEVARFKESGGERSASIVYETAKRTLTTFGQQGKMVSISSPMHKDDFMMKLLRQGKEMDNVMTVHKSTFEANPNITREDLAMEFQRDPDSAARDYLAQPPESLESYFKEPEKIEKVIDENFKVSASEYEVPDIEPIDYPCFLAGDPAFKNDRFGLAMSYFDPKEGLKIPIAHYFEPHGGSIAEIDAERVVNYIKEIIDKHNVSLFITDIWNYPSALKEIRKSGVKIEQNNVQRKEYDALKEQIYEAAKDGRKLLPPNEVLIKELKQLELHQGSRIDHPSHGSKDVADAVANSAYHCIQMKDGAVKPMAYVF